MDNIHVKKTRSEELVMVYPLSSPWFFEEEHFTLFEEQEDFRLKQLKSYKLYRRRLGSISNSGENGNSPLWVALQFYWSHLTLPSEHMRVMALWICLESLFNIGHSEIRKTIGHSVANLLAKSSEDNEKIYHDVVKLYDYRSSIIHGSVKKITQSFKSHSRSDGKSEFAELVSLHEYTRCCLRKIIERRRLSHSFMDDNKRISTIRNALLMGRF